jgi:hypothetical protein
MLIPMKIFEINLKGKYCEMNKESSNPCRLPKRSIYVKISLNVL